MKRFSGLPCRYQFVTEKRWAKNAEDRYQSAWGIKADLESCAQQLEETGKINNIQLGLQDISARFQIPQKLYGRSREVAMLLAAFNRVACSQNNLETTWEIKQTNQPAFKTEMMLVLGYAGIGKSALVRELYKPITQKRGYFIWGKFEQLGRNVPYSAIVDALQKLVQQLLGEPEEQVQQWRERLLTALGSNAQIIINVIPEVELIVGKQPPVAEVEATAARNRFNLTFQKFVRVFCSQEHPLTIFLDDLQWIDSATLELIELLLLDEPTQFLFLIGAYRDNEVNSTHPLVLTLGKLKKRGVVLKEIVLKPLTIETLNQLTEPDKLAAMQILSSITIAAYIAAPDLMPLVVSKQVNLSIQYGNTFLSPFAYANFGFVLCGMIGNIESGYEFGQLALKLLSRMNTHSLRARTLLIVNNFIIHWKEHAKEISQPLLLGYQIGVETGDLEFAAYCAHSYCLQSFVIGKELVEVEREMAKYNEAMRQIKQQAALTWTQIFQQSVLNLMGCSVNPTRLIGECYNEENRPIQDEKDRVVIFQAYLNKLILCYLFSEYSQAVENAILAKSHSLQGRAAPLEPLYYFYDSLARLATYSGSSDRAQEEILKNVALSQEKMKHWSDYAPMNHLHKYHLVQAETARVLGQLFEAEEFYEQAIQNARENGYIQEEALAYELAAKHYLARGRDKIAQTYMKEARYCYSLWGAMAKVKDLENRFPKLFPQSLGMPSTSIGITSGAISNISAIAFDFVAIMKASQMISREIELEQLLSSLIKIVIENAGAQTGFLILENDGKWTIEATIGLNRNVYETQVLQSIPITNLLPESIINYTIRTHECAILNDATREGNFINEPYIQRNQTQSILCLPLLDRGKLVGVLYLENQLTTGVFTPERSQVLKWLSTQAAIAIKNAKLYSKLREGESRMTQFLEAIPVAIMVVDAAGRPYYANKLRIQIVGKGVDPSVIPEQFAEVYQFYQAGTDRKYPTEKLPIVRAMKGESIRVDDIVVITN
ncbi:hypothetical protein NUACC21_18990 [Scytonema sp. NUACC21]